MKSKKAFFPISLGNHYYTNIILTKIREDISNNYQECALVICDHLRYLSYRIRGLKHIIAKEKVNTEVFQFKNRLKNCGYDSSNINIVTMSSLIPHMQYMKIESALLELINSEEDIFQYLNQLSMFTLRKLNNEIENDKTDSQTQYFVSETAMSIYVTECMGFNNEYYKQFDRGLVVILYDKYSEYLKKLLKKNALGRNFYSLGDVIQ